VLTITSNVVYGKRPARPRTAAEGAAFAPGANPSNGKDKHGALAALMSVAKIPYDDAEDGISLTCRWCRRRSAASRTASPAASARSTPISAAGGFHVNINVLNRETLQDAMKNPEKYPQLTIRCRIRGQFRQAHQGAAARRHQPHVPRPPSRSRP
jgi:formate C-acetyltransferase